MKPIYRDTRVRIVTITSSTASSWLLSIQEVTEDLTYSEVRRESLFLCLEFAGCKLSGNLGDRADVQCALSMYLTPNVVYQVLPDGSPT
jgi:hypothetical protein